MIRVKDFSPPFQKFIKDIKSSYKRVQTPKAHKKWLEAFAKSLDGMPNDWVEDVEAIIACNYQDVLNTNKKIYEEKHK